MQAQVALRRFAWGTLAATIGVILWGAYVRATGSGAGCGDHWPTCNGEVIPREPTVQTLIEFSHRATSGLVFIAVFALMVWSIRSATASPSLKRLAVTSMILMVLEAGIGASLVLFRLVAENQSMARAYVMSLHLVNTFLLLGALTLTARATSGAPPARLRGSGVLGGVFGAAVIGMLVLGVSGAVTALGDTLFPAESLRHGFEQHLSPTAHVLLRLRILHPLLAVICGLLIVAAAWTGASLRPSSVQRRWAIALSMLFGIQFVAGLVNVVLLAPVWLQLVHLLLADAVWIALVLAGANALSGESAAEGSARSAAPAAAA